MRQNTQRKTETATRFSLPDPENDVESRLHRDCSSLLGSNTQVPMALYRRLEPDSRDFRLLRFVGEPVPHCSCQLQLQTFTLDDAPPYDTLSYVWGIATPEHLISANNTSVRIGKSLHLALAQLGQALEANRWFWIDTICIDQHNADEKSSQVRRMRDIFQQAQTVWIALGDSSENIDSMLDLMSSVGPRALGAEVPDLWGMPVIHSTPAEVHPALLFLLEILKDDRFRGRTALDASTDLLQRPNWGRAWILQEMALAQPGNILCGDRVVDLDEFYATIAVIYFAKVSEFSRQDPAWQDFGGGLDVGYVHIPGLRARLERLRGDGTLFIDLLVEIRQAGKDRPWLEASDPRDIVYALMGVASDADRLGIVPNYRKPVVEVYAEVTRAMMAIYPQYKLGYSLFPKSLAGLPSWVPDWRQLAQTGVARYFLSGLDRFKASGDKIQPANKAVTTFVLNLRGAYVESVVKVLTIDLKDSQQTPLQGDMSLSEALWRKSSRASCVNSILKFAEPFIHTRSEAAVWKLMLAGFKGTSRDCPGFNALASPAFHQERTEATTISESQMAYMLQYSVPHERELVSGGDIQKFVDLFCESIVDCASVMARERTLFLTESGRLGLGPYQVQEGDSVTVLYGIHVPIILQPAGSNYLFVGESHVDGIMQGEVVEGVSEETVFTII